MAVTTVPKITGVFDPDAAGAITGTAARFDTLGVGVAVASAEIVAFTLSGTIASAASAVWSGFHVKSSTATISGSTNITTATGFNLITLEIPTLSAASALTVSNAATLYIAGAPTGAGAGPCTITNAYSLWLDAGNARFDGVIFASVGSAAAPAVASLAQPTSGVFFVSTTVCISSGGVEWLGVTTGGAVSLRSTAALGFSSGVPSASGSDVVLTRGAANHLYLATGDAFSIGAVAIASGTNLVQVANGTAPSSQTADSVSFFSTDNTAGNTIPSFYCEGTEVLATGQSDSASSVRVKMRINGTVVTLLAI